MWQVIDAINGVIYEHKIRYKLLDFINDLMDDYKRNNFNVGLYYIGNGVYKIRKEVKENEKKQR